MEYLGKFTLSSDTNLWSVNNLPQDGKDLIILLGIQNTNDDNSFSYDLLLNNTKGNVRASIGVNSSLEGVAGFYAEADPTQGTVDNGYAVYYLWVHDYAVSGEKSIHGYGGVVNRNGSNEDGPNHYSSSGFPTAPATSISIEELNNINIKAGSYMKIWKVTV